MEKPFRNLINLEDGYQFRNYDFVPKGILVIKITQCKTDGTLDYSKCDFVEEIEKRNLRTSKFIQR